MHCIPVSSELLGVDKNGIVTTSKGGEFSKEVSHHIANVMRMKVGEMVSITDGAGRMRDVKLSHIDKHSVSFDYVGDVCVHAKPSISLVLFQSIAKPARMDWLVEKVVELGVSELVPVLAERCSVKPKERIDRWNRIAEAAVSQCANPFMTKIGDPCSWSDAMERVKGMPCIIAALWNGERFSIKQAIEKIQRERHDFTELGLIIGPEGDFTEEELRSAVEAGAIPVTLGDSILRVETAAIYASSVIKDYFAW